MSSLDQSGISSTDSCSEKEVPLVRNSPLDVTVQHFGVEDRGADTKEQEINQVLSLRAQEEVLAVEAGGGQGSLLLTQAPLHDGQGSVTFSRVPLPGGHGIRGSSPIVAVIAQGEGGKEKLQLGDGHSWHPIFSSSSQVSASVRELRECSCNVGVTKYLGS